MVSPKVFVIFFPAFCSGFDKRIISKRSATRDRLYGAWNMNLRGHHCRDVSLRAESLSRCDLIWISTNLKRRVYRGIFGLKDPLDPLSSGGQPLLHQLMAKSSASMVMARWSCPVYVGGRMFGGFLYTSLPQISWLEPGRWIKEQAINKVDESPYALLYYA